MVISRLNSVATKTIAILLVVAFSAMTFAQTQWSDVAPDTVVDPVHTNPLPPGAPTRALTYYTNQAAFEAVAPSLPMETFPSSVTGPNNVCTDNSPLSSTSPGACFAAGDLIPGWSMDVVPNGGSGLYVLLTAGFLGIPFNGVGPNSFVDHTDFVYSPAVNAVGFDIVGDLITSVAVDIEVFDAGGVSLGTTTATGSLAGNFWGVVSDIPIGRIALRENAGGGEIIGNMQFGDTGCSVSSISVDSDGNVTVSGSCPAGQCVNIWASSNCNLATVDGGNATFLGCVPIGTTNVGFVADSCYYAADNAGNVLARTGKTVPTLGEGALVVFALLLLGTALFIMRKRKTA